MTEQRAAVFLDRDGTIMKNAHYLSRLDDIEIFKETAPALKRLHRAGYLLVVITNQSGVARGKFGAHFVKEAFAYVQHYLRPFGVAFDAQYYCPHHPEFSGPCVCRKPKPGMLYQAAEDLNIDLSRSFMVGDSPADIGVGLAAGAVPIFVTTVDGEKNRVKIAEQYPNTITLPSLKEVADFILDE